MHLIIPYTRLPVLRKLDGKVPLVLRGVERLVPAYKLVLPNVDQTIATSILGMDPDQVEEIIQAIYIPDRGAGLTIRHLWAQAASFSHDPLLEGYQPFITVKLKAPAVEMIRSAFFLLADYLYDPEERFYADPEAKQRTSQVVCCLFWSDKVSSVEAISFSSAMAAMRSNLSEDDANVPN